MKRISAAAMIAIVLWGATAMSSLTRAQDTIQNSRASGGLTNETLKQMLDGLGYEPKPLSQGYLVAIKKDGWTFNMQLVLSSDSSKLGFNANLGVVPDPDAVTAAQWKTLLITNGNIDPSFFYLDKDQKKLYLHRVLDNGTITPAYLRIQIENFCANIKNTADAWSFTK